MPKKLLVYASRFADDFEDARGFGWHVADAEFDWPALIAAKDKEIARLETPLPRDARPARRRRSSRSGPRLRARTRCGSRAPAAR